MVGSPRLPSMEAINAVSSPQTKAPAPSNIDARNEKFESRIFSPRIFLTNMRRSSVAVVASRFGLRRPRRPISFSGNAPDGFRGGARSPKGQPPLLQNAAPVPKALQGTVRAQGKFATSLPGESQGPGGAKRAEYRLRPSRSRPPQLHLICRRAAAGGQLD